MMKKSKINIDGKPFKLLLLPCNNIIKTRPLTIKGLYPVIELSVILDWIDDSNFMSYVFFKRQKKNG